MQTELKACPFCASHEQEFGFGAPYCTNDKCLIYGIEMDQVSWNTRPIEAKLEARIKELEDILANQVSPDC